MLCERVNAKFLVTILFIKILDKTGNFTGNKIVMTN